MAGKVAYNVWTDPGLEEIPDCVECGNEIEAHVLEEIKHEDGSSLECAACRDLAVAEWERETYEDPEEAGEKEGES